MTTQPELLHQIDKQIKKLTNRKLPQEEKEALQHTFKFWRTQLVPKMTDFVTTNERMATIEPHDKPVAIPEKFVWSPLNANDEKDITELHDFLRLNFIEDPDINIRPHYTENMLRWYFRKSKSWCIGVRVKATNKLVAFIGAVQSTVNINDKCEPMAEVNFLCIHKKLREKRFTPVLINELVRTVSKDKIFSAVFTSARYIPKPISTSQYHHRPLNLDKLVSIGFWKPKVEKDTKPEKIREAFELPTETKTEGMRLMRQEDVKEVLDLYNSQRIFNLHPAYTEQEFEHVFLATPDHNFVQTYVVETEMIDEENGNKKKIITDFASFYTMDSDVLYHDTHKSLKCAHLFYYAITITPINRLVRDMLIMAKKQGIDVFNALNIMENNPYLDDMKFEQGTGKVHYYFFNWLSPKMEPKQIGMCFI